MKLNGSEWEFAESVVETEKYGIQLVPLLMEHSAEPAISYDHILLGTAPVADSAADSVRMETFRARISCDAARLFDGGSESYIITLKERVMRLFDFSTTPMRQRVKRYLKSLGVEQAVGVIFISLCDDVHQPWEVTFRAAVRCSDRQELEAFCRAYNYVALGKNPGTAEKIIQPKVQLFKMVRPVAMPDGAPFAEPRAILTTYLEQFRPGDFAFNFNTCWRDGLLERQPPKMPRPLRTSVAAQHSTPAKPNSAARPHLVLIK